MSRVQLHRFVDLAKPEQRRMLRPAGLDRRSFVTGAAVLAGITGIASTAFAPRFRIGPTSTLSRPRHCRLGQSLRREGLEHNHRAAVHRHTVGRGTRLERGRKISALERHPERREPPLAGGRQSRLPALSLSVGNSNGNTFDYEGRQIACQHGTRKVVRYEHNGTTTVLAEKFEDEELQRTERRGSASE